MMCLLKQCGPLVMTPCCRAQLELQCFCITFPDQTAFIALILDFKG